MLIEYLQYSARKKFVFFSSQKVLKKGKRTLRPEVGSPKFIWVKQPNIANCMDITHCLLYDAFDNKVRVGQFETYYAIFSSMLWDKVMIESLHRFVLETK